MRVERLETRYRLVNCPRCGGSGRDPHQSRRIRVRGGVKTFPARCRLCLGLGAVFEEIPPEAYDQEAEGEPTKVGK